METKINPVYEFLLYFQMIKTEDRLGALDYQYYTLINENSVSELFRMSTLLEVMRMRMDWFEKDIKFFKQIIYN